VSGEPARSPSGSRTARREKNSPRSSSTTNCAAGDFPLLRKPGLLVARSTCEQVTHRFSHSAHSRLPARTGPGVPRHRRGQFLVDGVAAPRAHRGNYPRRRGRDHGRQTRTAIAPPRVETTNRAASRAVLNEVSTACSALSTATRFALTPRTSCARRSRFLARRDRGRRFRTGGFGAVQKKILVSPARAVLGLARNLRQPAFARRASTRKKARWLLAPSRFQRPRPPRAEDAELLAPSRA